jgi:hypothetical protein
LAINRVELSGLHDLTTLFPRRVAPEPFEWGEKWDPERVQPGCGGKDTNLWPMSEFLGFSSCIVIVKIVMS